MHLGGSMELGHLDILTIHAILIIKDNCVFCLIRRFDQELYCIKTKEKTSNS